VPLIQKAGLTIEWGPCVARMERSEIRERYRPRTGWSRVVPLRSTSSSSFRSRRACGGIPLRPLNPARDSLVKRSLPRCLSVRSACGAKPTWPPALPTSAFGSTSDRSDFVSRQPLGWASPQPSAGSNRQRRRPTFLRRHAPSQALSPRPAEPAFEGHGVQQSDWPYHQRFEAKPEHDENYSYPPLTQATGSSAQCEQMHDETEFPTPEEYCSTKGECRPLSWRGPFNLSHVTQYRMWPSSLDATPHSFKMQ